MKKGKKKKRYFPIRPLTSNLKEIIKNMPVRIVSSAPDISPAAGIDIDIWQEEERCRSRNQKLHQR